MDGKLLVKKQTKFQLIHLVQFEKTLNLYLDGVVQFTSKDEYRYHEALVHPAMAPAPSRENILIIGGGDGLAAREIFKYDDVKTVKLVDIDPEMVELCATEPLIAELNKGALKDPRLKYIPEDAWVFIQENQEIFDVIIVDLPDPEDRILAKLYSDVFYHMLGRRLALGGMMTVQSASPSRHKNTFRCIYRTVQASGLYVKPYHILVPNFGDWGFMLVSNEEPHIEKINVEVETKYLNKAVSVKDTFKFNEEIDLKNIIVNTADNFAISEYYEKTSIPVVRWVLPLIDS